MRTGIPRQDETNPGSAASSSKTRYRYTAKNMEGKIFRGTVQASDYDELYTLLRNQNLYLQRAIRLRETKNKPLTSSQLAGFCQALSNLLGSGVSLAPALRILSDDDLPKKQTALYQNILTDVSNGKYLWQAIEAQKIFPDLMVGILRSAEDNGDLPGATARLANHYTREHRLTRQIRSAMTYPFILAVMMLISLIVIFTFILPEFGTLFSEADTLPFFTRALMAVSGFLVNRWYYAMGGAVLLALLVRILLRAPSVRLQLDKWKLKTRFLGIGKLTSSICTARFARTICNLYSGGVPMVSAIRTASGTLGNRYLASQFEAVALNVNNGRSFVASLRDVDGLHRKLYGVIQVGMKTGHLDDMLDFIAESMEYDSDQASKRLVTLIEPVLIIIMSVIVGAVMIGVMYPIIGSYGAIWGSGY